MKQLIVCIMTVGIIGCGKTMQSANSSSLMAPSPSVTPATVSQCPNGGVVVNSIPICNGTNGQAGVNGQNGLGTNPGLQCNVYNINPSDYSSVVNFPTMFQDGVLKFTTIMSNFNIPNESSNNIFGSFTSAQQALIGNTNYAIDCSGYLNVPSYGFYTFILGSDDGSALFLDYQTTILMPQAQPFTTKSQTLVLQQGLNPIEVLYFQGPATNIGLTLSWQGPSNEGLGTMSIIPSTNFSH